MQHHDNLHSALPSIIETPKPQKRINKIKKKSYIRIQITH